MSEKPTYEELEQRVNELEKEKEKNTRIEKEFVKRQKYLESVFHHAPSAIITLDPSHHVLEWNPGAQKIFGYTSEEAQGKDLDDLVSNPEVKQEAVNNTLKVLSGQPLKSIESVRYRKDGTSVHVIASGSPIIMDNVLKGVVTLYTDISDRKQAEEALMESEEKYRTVLESIEDGYYEVDMKGNFTFLNDSMCKILGYSKDELTGLNNRRYMDEENSKEVFKTFNRVYKTGQPYKAIDWELIRKDGSRCYVETSVALKRHSKGQPIGFQGIARDITRRKQAEDALRVSHERFLTVLDSIDANIYVADMESYEILFMNKNLMNTFGKDLTGELCWEGFKGKSEPCKHCTNDQLIDENGKPTGLCTWQNKNPITGKWYINNDRAIEWADGRLVRIEIATDITDLKHMEEELRQAQKRESIGTLTGGIAHDFNNIMGIILGNTELALEDVPESNRAYSNLEAIKTASRRAANIVKQLSNLSRITDQKLQPIEIAPVIKDVLKFLRSTIPNTIDIQQDIQITNETILADPTQIKQIMMNLCINASHAMEQTGGKLTTTVENVFLDDSSAKDYPDLKSGKYVKVVVSDTGPGIDPKIINRIFDPYFTTKGIGKGSGMGLAVVHGIVKSHSGAITIDSTLGKGTKFIMFFPLVTEKPIVEVQTT